jgi:hypothetical protein
MEYLNQLLTSVLNNYDASFNNKLKNKEKISVSLEVVDVDSEEDLTFPKFRVTFPIKI